ncbi:GTP cyclohydrolase II [Candidatus Puniceispirillum marinum]|jgi:GTP cyclohydrolase II|uniref:GTP cyclohydrolase-2 n=1 Tax=Puniceispirillum marinum (strain IMCC1322) TaxID=488538 RepID=D5BUF3_PUNMI|nr:GTP cyclohydrolase II [Candidatus Puniceispirillum marinum]ADE39900.1 GTP cyclohydrolase II [Candidatus Puniceispirillum marinum IMCC1322]
MSSSNINRTYLKVDRACAELRRGGAVVVRLPSGEAAIFKAVEIAHDNDIVELKTMAGSGTLLVLTANRMSSLGHSIGQNKPCATLSSAAHSAARAFEMALGQPATDGPQSSYTIIPEKAGSLADNTTRLLRVAKLIPAAFMARLRFRDIAMQDRWALENNLLIIEARDVDHYNEDAAASLRETTRAKVPLALAEDAEIIMFRAAAGGEEHFAVLIGDPLGRDAGKDKPPLVRLHSQCVTGDVLGSLKCDCGDQLKAALGLMARESNGILIYLAQEGRDIGMLNKMRAYALQDGGLDTVDANHMLGFDTDERSFLPAANILQTLGISKMRLITNNPDKIAQIAAHGFEISERISLDIDENPFNADYLKTKKTRTGHLID